MSDDEKAATGSATDDRHKFKNESGDGSSRRNKPTELALPGLLLGGVVVVAAFGLLAAGLSAAAKAIQSSGESFNDWLAAAPDSLFGRVQWMVGDITEPQFYKSPLAAIALLIGATIAWWAGRRGYRWAGWSIAFGSGLWPWILAASSLSLLLSNIAFGWRLDEGWQPTFVPFVCVATAVVLVYGRGWRVAVTGAVLGAVTTTPLAMLLIATVTGPLDQPAVEANTAAMSIGTAISFLLCRVIPWMPAPKPKDEASSSDTENDEPTGSGVKADTFWTIRRVIADYTETQFYANELASIALIVGVSAAVLLNPAFPAYGTELLPQILFAQALTSTIGVIVWRHLYRNGGWAPTYISLVSVAPAAVLTYNGDWFALVAASVIGALICPPIARFVSKRLPDDFHPFIGNTVSMAVSTAIVISALGIVV